MGIWSKACQVQKCAAKDMSKIGAVSGYHTKYIDYVVVSTKHGRSRRTTQKLTSMFDLHGMINEQAIHGKILENKQLAKKYIPNSYRKPIETMMFVTCKINGQTVKALVDSGCTKTTLSHKVAKRCGITSFIDEGTKKCSTGVGEMSNVGSIHFMLGEFGNLVLPLSLDVDAGLTHDMVLGLDFMQFHNIIISMPKMGLEIFSKFQKGLEGFVPFKKKLLFGIKHRERPLRSQKSFTRLANDLTDCKLFTLMDDHKSEISPKLISCAWTNEHVKGIKFLIKQQIREGSTEANIRLADEYIPKQYQKASPMLAIRCKINGKTIKAVVDSGCNSTVMSRSAADRCGISK